MSRRNADTRAGSSPERTPFTRFGSVCVAIGEGAALGSSNTDGVPEGSDPVALRRLASVRRSSESSSKSP